MIETGLVIALLVAVVLGIVEFGYYFFALHMVANAARDGARVAAALQNRGGCGAISDSSSIGPLVTNQLTGIVTIDGGACCGGGVCVTQCVATAGGTSTCSTPPATNCPAYTGTDIPTVKVTVAGHIPVLFGLMGSSPFAFCRSATFRDEGR
jgi:Flp pilus assembly protein TadG